MKNSIKTRVAVLISLLAFAVAFSIGKYTNNVTSNELQNNQGKSLLNLSKHVGTILDREMLERYREIKFAASLPTMTNPDVPKSEKRKIMERIQRSYNHHRWIGYALPDGTVEIGSDGYLEGKNAKARPWLPAGLKGPYVGDVHDALLLSKLLPNTSGESIYFSDVAFPVKNSKDGKVMAVLCTHLMWQWTRDIVRDIQRENGVEIYLLSKDGLILVGPGKTERENINKIAPGVMQQLSKSKKQYKVINWKNDATYLTAYSVSKGISEYKGLGWQVLIRENTNDAFKQTKENEKNIFLVSLLIGVIGALLGIFISSRIVKPLENLDKIVEDIEANKDVKFDKDMPKDEIGTLHNTIKKLYESLKETSSLNTQAQKNVQIALQIFDQSKEAIIVTNTNNEIILTNKAFCDATGYTKEEVHGVNPSILSSKEHDKEFYEKMWQSITDTSLWEGTITNKRKDGTFYTELLTITTLSNDNNEAEFYVATFREIKK